MTEIVLVLIVVVVVSFITNLFILGLADKIYKQTERMRDDTAEVITHNSLRHSETRLTIDEAKLTIDEVKESIREDIRKEFDYLNNKIDTIGSSLASPAPVIQTEMTKAIKETFADPTLEMPETFADSELPEILNIDTSEKEDILVRGEEILISGSQKPYIHRGMPRRIQ